MARSSARPMFRALRAVVALAFVLALVPGGASATGSSAGATTAPAGKVVKQFFTDPDINGNPKRPGFDSSAVVVKWNPAVPAAQRAAAAAMLGFKVTEKTRRFGWQLVQPTDPAMSGEQLLAALRKSGLVVQAERSTRYTTFATPNDPLFSSQWSLRNTGQNGGTPGADIAATTAWDTTTGAAGPLVAVVDTGIWWSHPDLRANIWTNPKEIPNNGVDDDRNGYVDDYRGYDFANRDTTVFDAADGDDHGTHVAGTIGAVGNNGLGVAGVAWKTRIMPVKALGPMGGWDVDLADAIAYAVDNGAKFINCSWGSFEKSSVLFDAVKYAAAHGVVLVCSSGNSFLDIDNLPVYPASYDTTNVISVGATDRNDKPAVWGNTGSQSVDLFAPGDEITSTVPPTQAAFSVKRDYRAVYVPVQAEVLEPTGTALHSIVTDTMRELDLTRTVPVLLVDGSAPKSTKETPGERAALYQDALSDLGYTDVATWDVEAKGTPSQADASGKAVLWFTGRESIAWQNEPSISASDARFISTLLDRGGRFALFSGEAATDLYFLSMLGPDMSLNVNNHEVTAEPYDGMKFLYKYFGVTFVDFQLPSAALFGKKGTSFEDVSARIPEAYRTYDETAQLSPTDSDWAMAVNPLDLTVKTVLEQDVYAAYSGTSMASPHVTGAAAVLMSQFPSASAEEIVARIENTVKKLPALKDLCVFDGRLDLAAALGAYPGKPAIKKPATNGLVGIGAYQLQWSPAAAGLPGATFEAQLGKPVPVFDNGFESGTLGGFETTGTADWRVTSNPADVFSGAFAARSGEVSPGVPVSIGGGWYEMVLPSSVLSTTVTVPPGGAKLSFRYWQESMPTDSIVTFWAHRPTGQDAAFTFFDNTDGWREYTCELPAGDITLEWGFNHGYGAPYLRDGMGIDDVKVTGLDWEPLATAPAGATSAEVTIPGGDTEGAAIRLRSNFEGVDSAWAYATKLRITSDTEAPAAPSGLAAVPAGNGRVDVSWTNPTDADFDSVKVLRRTDTFPTGIDDASATVVAEATSTAVRDGVFKDGSPVYYSAWATDKVGNVSEAARSTCTVVDKTPPPDVSFLGAQWVEGAPYLSWMLPDPGEYAKVKVLRRLDTTPTAVNDSAATLVFEGDGASAYDFLLGEEDPTSVSPKYAVYMIDESGNVSNGRFVELKAQPEPPTAMIMLAEGEPFVTSPEVSVDSYIDAPPTAAQMRLFMNGEIDDSAPWVPFEDRTNVDLANVDGPQTVLAQFKLADGTVLEARGDIYLDLETPTKPELFSGKSWNAGVKLEWKLPDDPTIAEYSVRHSYSSTGPFSEVALVPVQAPPAVPEGGGETPPGGFSGLPADLIAQLIGASQGGDGSESSTPTAYVTSLRQGVRSYLKIVPIDAVGHEGPASDVVSVVTSGGIKRIAGSTPYTTAEGIVAAGFARTDTVVVAGSASPGDALCAEGLAGTLGAPLLLTSPSVLQSATVRSIKRLRPKRIVIVGNTTAVPSNIARGIGALVGGTGNVERISARDRYSLSVNVARYLMEMGGASTEAFLVSGENPADSMAVGPLAYAQGMPVLFTKRSGVPSAVKSFVANSGIDHLVVADNTYWIPEGAVPVTKSGFRRIVGRDRYNVSVNLANYAIRERQWATPNVVGVASGTDLRSAVVAGSSLGNRGGVLLLTPLKALTSPAYNVILRNRAKLSRVEIYGGYTTVSSGVQASVRKALTAEIYSPYLY